MPEHDRVDDIEPPKRRGRTFIGRVLTFLEEVAAGQSSRKTQGRDPRLK